LHSYGHSSQMAPDLAIQADNLTTTVERSSDFSLSARDSYG